MNWETNTNKRVILKLLEKNNINDDANLLKFINSYLNRYKDDKISFFTNERKLCCKIFCITNTSKHQ